MILNLNRIFTLELAHDLGDRFAGRGDHVRQVLVRQAHAEDRTHPVGFAEAIAEVQEQGRKTGRDLPVQEALYDLVGLSESLGERGKELHGELRMALYGLGERALLDAGHPRVGHNFGKDVLPATLDEAQLAKYPALLEQSGGGLLIVAVDLVQAHGAIEQEVEPVVRISWGEDNVLCPEAPFDQSDAHPLEVFGTQNLHSRGGY